MIKVAILYPLFYIYWEILLKFLLRIPFNVNLLTILLGGIALGSLVAWVHSLLPEKVHRVLYYLNLFVLSFYFGMQLCLDTLFGFYFEWGLIAAAEQVFSSSKEMIKLILSQSFGILLILLPLLLSIVFHKHISFVRGKKRRIRLGFVMASILLYGGSLYLSSRISNAFDLSIRHHNMQMSVENYGAVPSLLIDGVKRTVGVEDEIEVIEEEGSILEFLPEVKHMYEPHALDVDFESLMATEEDETILQLHEFFSHERPTLSNQYTGMFEGKNLIFILAESFNEIAVEKTRTPTLYKLIHEGFYFTDFYTPTINSTIGGELQELTSLYNGNSMLQSFKRGENYYPFAIGKLFNDAGYSTFAYHNGVYNFQSRDQYLKAAGFHNYKACRNGLEEMINCGKWPQSDIEMIEATVPEYINEEHFMTYYVTISGHGSYDFDPSENGMSAKYEDYLRSLNLGVSDGALAYLGGEIELDRALELLLQKLEENGKLEDTVIALVGDHYPYYLTDEQVNELSTYEKDGVIEINHSNFILYNAGMTPTTITKVGSQIDVMPTIYNLFDLPYDSRFLIGKDILSNAEGLAIFQNHSWVSDYGRYYARSNKFVPKEGVTVDDAYVERMNAIVNNRAVISSLLINNDYYRYVFE